MSVRIHAQMKHMFDSAKIIIFLSFGIKALAQRIQTIVVQCKSTKICREQDLNLGH